MINRRTFVASSVAAIAASAKPFPRPWGVQIYTVRTLLPKDPDGTLKRISEIGYKEVELYAVNQIEQLVPIAEKYGMKATSIHIPDSICLAEDQSEFAKALDAAKKAGIEYAGVPYVAPSNRGTSADAWKTWCGKMNRAAGTAKKAGLKFFYHHHAFEFAGKKGERFIDVMKANFDPQLVKLEMDIFWAAAGGENPIAFLKEWKGRIALMHVKDRAAEMGTITTESQAKATDFKEVGNGNLPIAKILETALKTGVDKFYVEQDQSTGNPLDSLKISFDNAKKISV